MKLEKGSNLKIVRTAGISKGNYDLYDIRGLSLGKLRAIYSALILNNQILSEKGLSNSITTELSNLIGHSGFLADGQTINGE